MSNLFHELLRGPNGAEKKILVSTYPYDKNVKTTTLIGMSDDGNSPQMSKDIDELIKYVELLVGGQSTSSVTEEPLGNEYEDNSILNPFEIMPSFLTETNPHRQQINMQTITDDVIQSSEKHYLTLIDTSNMDPCTFSNGTNPVTGQKCKKASEQSQPEILIPNDPLAELYFAGLGVLGLFILYRLMEKSH
jgi:hypothetical protein